MEWTGFLFGFAGMAAALGIFGGGAVFGWQLHKAAGKGPVTARTLSPEEEKRLREEQEAFHRLQNYTVEDAYGINGGTHSAAH